MSPTVFTVPNIPLLQVFLCRRVERRSGQSAVSACACISDALVDPIRGVPSHGMYARLSLCACVNENDREKECYAEMNEWNDFYV